MKDVLVKVWLQKQSECPFRGKLNEQIKSKIKITLRVNTKKGLNKEIKAIEDTRKCVNCGHDENSYDFTFA